MRALQRRVKGRHVKHAAAGRRGSRCSSESRPAPPGARHGRGGPLPDSCIAAIASYSIASSALTSRAGDVIKHRRRLSFPRVLVEHAQHGERHGLNPGLDGRLRHRREQGRVVARQLRTRGRQRGRQAQPHIERAGGRRLEETPCRLILLDSFSGGAPAATVTGSRPSAGALS
jgi:hypothetical protein